MDELLLRPSAGLFLSKSAGGEVMVNGHLFKTNK
jgi:hypothetical protein